MKERPLSPHLQIYRLPMTAVLSISHRITGVLLVLGLVAFTGLMLAAVAGSDFFSGLLGVFTSPLGRLAVWLWVFAMYFHACHGVRHLLWDLGHGFDRERQGRYNVIEAILPVVLTIATFFMVGSGSDQT